MSEFPERPRQPGAETDVAKAAAAGLQAALDATFNAVAGREAEHVEQELRSQMDRHGVAGAASDAWVAQAAERVAAGEPVVAEPGDA